MLEVVLFMRAKTMRLPKHIEEQYKDAFSIKKGMQLLTQREEMMRERIILQPIYFMRH